MVQNLKKYIVTTSKKSGSSNKLCYCKACYDKYGENNPELKAIVNKTNHILSHFRNCRNFDEAYELEEKETILSLASKKKTNLGKRSGIRIQNKQCHVTDPQILANKISSKFISRFRLS
ncbi:hypothetical protein Glove_140g186 [Diversispora epigaea]|uniref:Uncharacterized protein n=1 Tax=Diversispora epigaea TaxID=1348612 RepID=A0A397J3U0_9GLOM|nr:hypothetical protein Glove_140g186 [Diversispora epigaea]